ncbi:MAG: NAD(P) transhydrogenase subunit alpha [Acidimicrobiia bacterium]
MRIGTPIPVAPERRVALTPDSVGRLVKAGHEVVVETDCGRQAGHPDAAYEDAGATIGDPWAGDLVAVIGLDDPARVRDHAAVVGLIRPLEEPERIAELAERDVTVLALELLPRTTLAQSMDVLSSQATVAGYEAVLAAATRSGRFFPMLTTAAGTVKPARVLVLGAGVAGLQAIATARRLGAVVRAFDVRSAAAEQVESLGASFVEVDLSADHTDAGGYATELAADEQTRIIRGLDAEITAADIVVTTAQIPGRPAPLLIDDQSLAGAGAGTVIVDVAAATGGNVSATVPGEEVEVHGVAVLGPTDLAARLAGDASALYGRNIVNLLAHLVGEDGALTLDFDDEIADGVVVAHGGEVRHPRVRELLEDR